MSCDFFLLAYIIKNNIASMGGGVVHLILFLLPPLQASAVSISQQIMTLCEL